MLFPPQGASSRRVLADPGARAIEVTFGARSTESSRGSIAIRPALFTWFVHYQCIIDALMHFECEPVLPETLRSLDSSNFLAHGSDQSMICENGLRAALPSSPMSFPHRYTCLSFVLPLLRADASASAPSSPILLAIAEARIHSQRTVSTHSAHNSKLQIFRTMKAVDE